MKYNYLLATDMDFTLLLPGQNVPEENLRAAKLLKEHGIALTISTGRSAYLVRKFADVLDIDVPLITGNGGVLYDAKNKLHVTSHNFPKDKAKNLLRTFIENKIDATMYSPDGILFCPDSSRHGFCHDYNKDQPDDMKAPLYDINLDILDDPNMPEINKFLLINCPDDMANMLLNDKDLEVVSSGPTFYDVMVKDVSKGNALMELADILGIPRENTFAIGDSDNDIPMISMAAHGIAMANSTPEVLKCADYVTSSCKDNGFAKAIEEYVFAITG